MIESVNDETIFTTLCEDVFSLVNVQVDLLHEYLLVKKMEKSEAGQSLIIVSLLCIIRNLHQLQMKHRDRFLHDIVCSCAAANDFMRMIECFDELMESVHRRYPRLKLLLNHNAKNEEDAIKLALLERECSDLVALYGNDAVFAVQRSQIFVMKTIQQSSIPDDLFSQEWEDEFVYNEVALAIVKTVEDFLYNYHDHLSNAFLYGKIVGALVRAVVCFYVRCLVQKADNVRRRKRTGSRFGPVETPFLNSDRAVLRMMYDIEVFRQYFRNLVKQLPALKRLVEDELSILVVIHECLSLSTDNRNDSTLEEFIVVLHKRTGANVAVTKFVMKDLWHLAARYAQRLTLNDTLALMQGELQLLSNNLEESKHELVRPRPRDYLPGLQLKEVLEQFYDHRILQERLRPCGPCMNLVRKSEKSKSSSAVRPRPIPDSPTGIESLLDFLTVPEDDKIKVPWSDMPAVLPTFNFGDNIRQLPEMRSSCAGKRSVNLQSVSLSDESSREGHEKTLKTVREKLFAKLKLHNIHFVAHSTMDFEKRLAEINGWG